MDTVFGFDAIAFWIVATGALVGISGGLLGSFLVLRKMSLLGDAISHAVLPGLALAFLVTNSRASLPMFIGALLAGLATVVLIQVIQRFSKVPEDAAMGVVFTSLFALGVIILTYAARQVDLDPGCVLYGILESAALDTYPVLGMEIPRITLTMGVATLGSGLFTLLFWKELKLAAFDPGLATTLGYNATLIHYLLMGMVAIVTVAAFEAVGSILVVAMLIAPPAAAYLLTDRLWVMVSLASVIGVLSAIAGRAAGARWETGAAGMMAVAAGGQFFLAVIFAPRYGVLSRRVHHWRLSMRILREDILGILYRWQELSRGPALPRAQVLAAVGGGLLTRAALWHLSLGRWVREVPEGLILTDAGQQVGRTLIRAHRMWETYLAKHLSLPLDHLHGPADRMEHYLDAELQRHVAEDLVEPALDPHGREIPPGGGRETSGK